MSASVADVDALIERHREEWEASTSAPIRELGCQFRAINQKRDELTCVGTVIEKRAEGGEHLVVLELNILNQTGARTTTGRAIVVLPSRAST